VQRVKAFFQKINIFKSESSTNSLLKGTKKSSVNKADNKTHYRSRFKSFFLGLKIKINGLFNSKKKIQQTNITNLSSNLKPLKKDDITHSINHSANDQSDPNNRGKINDMSYMLAGILDQSNINKVLKEKSIYDDDDDMYDTLDEYKDIMIQSDINKVLKEHSIYDDDDDEEDMYVTLNEYKKIQIKKINTDIEKQIKTLNDIKNEVTVAVKDKTKFIDKEALKDQLNTVAANLLPILKNIESTGEFSEFKSHLETVFKTADGIKETAHVKVDSFKYIKNKFENYSPRQAESDHKLADQSKKNNIDNDGDNAPSISLN